MPERPIKSKIIGGYRYDVTLLGGKEGRGMIVRIVRLMGPTLASFLQGTLKAQGGFTESLTTGISDSLREIASRITEDEVADISDRLAHFTVVNISRELQPQLDTIFDEHFAGHYDAMLAWLAFALEANFSSFFDGTASDRRALADRAKTLWLQLFPSPLASTGTSTASPAASATPQA